MQVPTTMRHKYLDFFFTSCLSLATTGTVYASSYTCGKTTEWPVACISYIFSLGQ